MRATAWSRLLTTEDPESFLNSLAGGLGFGEPAPADARTRRALGVPDDLTSIRLAAGPGTTRLILAVGRSDLSGREQVGRLAGGLSRKAPTCCGSLSSWCRHDLSSYWRRGRQDRVRRGLPHCSWTGALCCRATRKRSLPWPHRSTGATSRFTRSGWSSSVARLSRGGSSSRCSDLSVEWPMKPPATRRHRCDAKSRCSTSHASSSSPFSRRGVGWIRIIGSSRERSTTAWREAVDTSVGCSNRSSSGR